MQESSGKPRQSYGARETSDGMHCTGQKQNISLSRDKAGLDNKWAPVEASTN